MPPQETPPIDIPPPPEAERLAALKARRDELEQQLSDEKAKLRRMQADRRALLRQQIKRSQIAPLDRRTQAPQPAPDPDGTPPRSPHSG